MQEIFLKYAATKRLTVAVPPKKNEVSVRVPFSSQMLGDLPRDSEVKANGGYDLMAFHAVWNKPEFE